ncbi:LysR substrate-binding domain-containing protein [Litorisediminicola beolgyonensis]|uniref:LysR substrate-binding domain-containing protein n=1 Tax=Litorisediminicola beolgyonensis TaxID=1173614 RepID=A0ABW3ZK26_9RHOB
MLDPALSLRQVRVFLEIARLGSLSAAADTLNVSQPAVSKTLKDLEDLLGTALFDRTGRGMVLTRAGRLFQRHSGAAVVDLEKAQDLVRGGRGRGSRLAIGLLPTVATDIAPRAALAFRQRFPDTVLRLSTGPNWMLRAQLLEGALDMVVGRMAAAELMEGLSFRQLYTDRIVAVVRPGHPLIGNRDPSALATVPLMLPPAGAVIAATVRAFLLRSGLQAEEPAFETVSLAFGRKVVMLSDTVWFISQGVIADELAAGSLATLDVGDPLLAGPVGISMRDQAVIGPDLAGLIEAFEMAAGEAQKNA